MSHPMPHDTLATRARRRGAFVSLLAAAGLIAASAASAATYYVSTSGSDSNSGTSASSPWRTIGKASATMVAGDQVRISPGTYGETLQPQANGTSTNRITYVGDLSNPAGVVVNAISFYGFDYVSVKGITSSNDILIQANTSGNSANNDSLVSCIGRRGLSLGGAWYCVVSGCAVGSGTSTDKLNIGVYPGDVTTSNASITAWCTLQDNTFNFATGGGANAMTFSHMRNNRFVRNRHTLTILPGASDTHSNSYYRVKNNTFIDCFYTLRNQAATGDIYVFNQRDSSVFNTWVRDTFQVDPSSPGTAKFEFATSGAFPGACGHNSWIDCLVKVDGALGYQNPARGDLIQGCVFAAKGSFQPKGDSLTFRHNTFANLAGPIVWDTQQTDLTNTRIVSNLFYATGTAGSAHNYLPDVASVKVDSNLVWATGNDPGRAEYIRSSGSFSAVGSGTAWCTGYGKDCNSQWTDPQLTSASWSALDLRPRSGSAAYDSRWSDGYVGAYSAQSLVGDTTPPATTSNLAVSSPTANTLLLTWTAPGDDGGSGIAYAYDIRWSTSPINSGNFDTATPFSPVPDPLVGGSSQSFVATGLAASTTYYFALRTRDEANNWSGVSNSPSGTTAAGDVTPPNAINDLSAGP